MSASTRCILWIAALVLLWLVPPILNMLLILKTLVPVVRTLLFTLGVSSMIAALVAVVILILDRFIFIALIRMMLYLVVLSICTVRGAAVVRLLRRLWEVTEWTNMFGLAVRLRT